MIIISVPRVCVLEEMGVAASKIKANFHFINHNAAAATGDKKKKTAGNTPIFPIPVLA